MLSYPEIDPVAFSLGPLKIHWYGICYVVGIMSAWYLLRKRSQHADSNWNQEEVDDLIFYATLGIIIGGRLGSVIFYNLSEYLANPMEIFKIWNGGMSFHGGLLGVLVAMFLFCRSRNKAFFMATDFIAPVVPLGLGAGRIGNFINGELWGKVSDVPWAMVFPKALPLGLARHPSQLYQFLLEGVVLFLILWFFSAKPRPTMSISALFLLFYGVFRILVEFVRVPDEHIGYLAFGWLTKGQVLSLPMIVFGLLFLRMAYRSSNSLKANSQ